MANWQILKTAIADVIKTNGNQEITGQLLQNVLNNIVTSVGENATFVDIATPNTNPGIPDGPVFYIAAITGEYPNFGGITLADDEVVILLWNGTWQKKNTGIVKLDLIKAIKAVTVAKLPIGNSNLFRFNLLDKNDPDYIEGYFLTSSGNMGASANYSISGYIPFTKEMGTLIASINGAAVSGGSFICYYDKYLNLIKAVQQNDSNGKAIWEEGVAAVRFNFANKNANLQVEIGDTITDYIPYGTYLLKDQVVDTDNLVNGIITREKLANESLISSDKIDNYSIRYDKLKIFKVNLLDKNDPDYIEGYFCQANLP